MCVRYFIHIKLTLVFAKVLFFRLRVQDFRLVNVVVAVFVENIRLLVVFLLVRVVGFGPSMLVEFFVNFVGLVHEIHVVAKHKVRVKFFLFVFDRFLLFHIENFVFINLRFSSF